MNDPSLTHLFLDESSAAPVPDSVQRAYFWVVCALGTAVTALLLVFAVATQSGADSERIARSDGNGVKALLSAVVASHGRPGAL